MPINFGFFSFVNFVINISIKLCSVSQRISRKTAAQVRRTVTSSYIYMKKKTFVLRFKLTFTKRILLNLGLVYSGSQVGREEFSLLWPQRAGPARKGLLIQASVYLKELGS